MSNGFTQSIMVRFSEIAIKGKRTRARFTRELVNNIEYVLEKFNIKNIKIDKHYSRIFVFTDNLIRTEKIIANYIPGVASVSRVIHTELHIKKIHQLINEKFFPKIIQHSSFAVNVKRVGKHPFTSVEFAAKIGEYILENLENPPKVDLSSPEYTLNIEIRDEKVYLFDDIMQGLGGLPAGSQGRVLVICSNNLEDISTVLQLYKRGAITLIHFIKNESDISKYIIERIKLLVSIQKTLQKERQSITYSDIFEINEIIKKYEESKCSALAMSTPLFHQYSKVVSPKVPLFVPHLVEEFNKNEIDELMTLR